MGHFKQKFSPSTVTSDVISHATNYVDTKYKQLQGKSMNTRLNKSRVNTFIKQLKRNCAPGIDGILSEHLLHVYSIGTKLVE